MRNLELIFEELSHIEYMVKESNSTIDSNLIYEGFWDTVRKGAEKIGQFGANVRNAAVSGVNAVKGAVDYVKELGQKAWDKIVALGQEFVEWVKLAKQKINEVLQIIKGTPAKVYESLKSFYTWLAQGVSKIIDKIKNGWDTFVLIMKTFIFKPIAQAFRDAIETVQLNHYYYKAVLADDLKSLKTTVEQAKGKGTEKFNALMEKISSFFTETVPNTAEEVGAFLAKAGKSAGLILLGIIALPFIVAFKTFEYGYKLASIFVETIFEECGKAWAEMKTLPGSVKTGYQSVPKVAMENARNVMSFDQFIKRS